MSEMTARRIFNSSRERAKSDTSPPGKASLAETPPRGWRHDCRGRCAGTVRALPPLTRSGTNGFRMPGTSIGGACRTREWDRMNGLPEARPEIRDFFHRWLETFSGFVRDVDY